jgi:hypothetical protein
VLRNALQGLLGYEAGERSIGWLQAIRSAGRIVAPDRLCRAGGPTVEVRAQALYA